MRLGVFCRYIWGAFIFDAFSLIILSGVAIIVCLQYTVYFLYITIPPLHFYGIEWMFSQLLTWTLCSLTESRASSAKWAATTMHTPASGKASVRGACAGPSMIQAAGVTANQQYRLKGSYTLRYNFFLNKKQFFGTWRFTIPDQL